MLRSKITTVFICIRIPTVNVKFRLIKFFPWFVHFILYFILFAFGNSFPTFVLLILLYIFRWNTVKVIAAQHLINKLNDVALEVVELIVLRSNDLWCSLIYCLS